MHILIDGGFCRSSNVLKAICRGASAVGFERNFKDAVKCGQGGVKHAVKSELSLSLGKGLQN